ncbi:DHHA1 domain-containing protein [Haloferacaceae archaeon DSL9]
MVHRLVLGSGPIGRALVERASDQPEDLHVITADRGWATTLRDSSIAAAEGDPRDPHLYPSTANIVVVTGESERENAAIATVARKQFPDAMLLVAVDGAANARTRDRIDDLADIVVDKTTIVRDRILDAVAGPSGDRAQSLLTTLRSLSGPLAVVTHDNPDPDAIASAIALVRIADIVGVPADACYAGEISHQENRALVNLLDISMRHFDPEDIDLSGYGGVALVDHSRPGVNNSLPEDTPVQIVIDHHPPRAPISVDRRFVDIRSDVGSTSTLLTDYFRRLGIEPDTQTATALLYGIRIDTKDFTREITEIDFDAASYLLPYVDQSVLERVEAPSVSGDVLRILAAAIRNRERRGTAVATCVGPIHDRDAIAQAADRLLNMEGVKITVVYGYVDGVVYVSGRARGTDIDLGETLRSALGQIGSAGGHADMAGAQVPLGILAETDDNDDEALERAVRETISGRFFEALDDAPQAPAHSDNVDGFPKD